jgi:pimeloyl-ACP methyl ester carboxylesterase
MSEQAARRTLYAPIEPYRTGRLRVSAVHEMYFEESGNPQGKPVVFVHGGPGGGTDAKRYDVVCPMKVAWDLHCAFPEADLRIVPDAGHSSFEPGNVHELVTATDAFRTRR